MNVEALRQTIRVLQEVSTRKQPFDLDSWVSVPEGSCGTTCCAVGYAALDPWFQKHGFQLRNDNGRGETFKTIDAFDQPSSEISWPSVIYKRHKDWSAVRKFYDLSDEQATHLFSSDSYKITAAPRHVINRIKKLLKETSEGVST